MRAVTRYRRRYAASRRQQWVALHQPVADLDAIRAAAAQPPSPHEPQPMTHLAGGRRE